MPKSYIQPVTDPTWDTLSKQYDQVKHVVVNLARHAKSHSWGDVAVFSHWLHVSLPYGSHPRLGVTEMVRTVESQLVDIFGTVDDIPLFTTYHRGGEQMTTQLAAVRGLDNRVIAMFELRVALTISFDSDDDFTDEDKIHVKLTLHDALVNRGIIAPPEPDEE